MDGRADLRERWRLHRGGVVNIWQYAEEEFDLSGGRVILKGTNGSGKSRTLELLLPLCLDGDLRNMGCKGFDTVSMSRLMLDDYTAGRSRVGYAWIELRRVRADGTEEFLTCGIGVKASASSRQVSDSWRFITPARVNKDFALMEQQTPISQSRLREHIGESAVVAGQEAFQERVAAAVYGITGGNRYTDLLHLQRTLRNPDIGLKVLQGQLEQLLSDALPPIDPDVIARTAAGLDNLEGVRRNVARLRRADAALQEFLTGYRAYARGILADRAARLEDAEKALGRARRARDRRETERAASEAELVQARLDRDSLTERAEQVETELSALKASPAYGALGDLEDKAATVDSRRSHVESALGHTRELRAAEEQSIAAIGRAAASVVRLGEGVAAQAERAREELRAIGLPATLGALPRLVPDLERASGTVRALLSPEPDARPEELHRELPPRLDVAALERAAQETGERADAAARAAAERAPVLAALRARAEQVVEAEERVERLGERAATAAEEAVSAARRVAEGEERLRAVADQWVHAVRRWREEAPPAGDRPEPGELPAAPEPAEVIADPEGFRDAQREARAALQPRVRAVQHAAVVAEQRLAQVNAERGRLEAELRRLREAVEVELAPPALTTAPRDPRHGAPFYRLVDFAPDLPEPDRAGLEAALHASGLLSAWVRADGGIESEGDDVWARPRDRVEGPNLADVLRPATDSAGPVSEELVGRLLESVPLLGADHDAHGRPSVGCDGRWRAGVLSGRHTKSEAEHIGAGARELARRRRIAAVEAELTALTEQAEGFAASLRAAQELERAWQSCLDSFPEVAEVLRAHFEAQARRSAARRAADEAERAEGEHARARARLGAERSEHQRACGELGVTEDAEGLRELCERARRAIEALERMGELLRRDHPDALRSLTASQQDHERAARAREQAEAQAHEAHRGYAEAHATLAKLRSTLGRDAGQVGEEVRQLEEERRRLRSKAPGAQERVENRVKALADAEGRLENAEKEHARAEADVADAEDALTDTAEVPGVWEAATGAEEPPFDRTELRAAIAAALEGETPPGEPAALERDLLGRIQTLQTALAGTHDVQADRTRGVLTVAVSEEAGTAPVAATARRTAERLTLAEDNLTGREERIFEEYLLGDVAEELHRQIGSAESLTRRMNAVLENARSSQGVRVELSWEPAPDLDPAERSAFALAKKSVARRTPEENERLRRALMDRIRATRAEGRSSGYAEVLAGALDYRRWYSYRVRIHDTGPDGQPRDRRIRQLSSGETRLVSYVTLFAASAAFYDALETELEGPLRLVLLDEAFERLDDPTIARLLELLVDLDMDWAITWPSGYGVSPKIDRMHIYDILKRKGAWGVACARTTWNGSGFERAA
ncbi:TIGR02680 family protein [Marinactinospora thermotolerans]|uniref:TIGR02680 family protein n=1 Tax=Marinactinospora thermotolerans DSM 45154 TaxID=1122192 RepID=A0A1T4M7K9_9ACTN|nr:TIGR02680 family protein [Marinactinospora thermotolerans]SJZ62912.1 TIGR02680 family protein [Marinactinospora thermotolerans DSM 45154]